MNHEIFADSPETKAWLDAVAAVPEAEWNRVQIPDANTWREWLRYVEIPEEDLEEVIATTPDPQANPQLYELLQRGAALVISAMGDINPGFRFAALADFNHAQYRYFYVHLLTACLPFVQEYHRSLGVPEEISQATLADLGRNVRVHRKREGVGGLGVMWWLMLHFRGIIYHLGRLQFELQHAGAEIAASMRTHGIDADESTHVLSIHIPDFMGPMDHEACTDSFQQATRFFSEYFPNWPMTYGVCHSWLLDPQLKQILKPESNIIRFQDRFILADGAHDSSDTVMQFVFGRHVRDIDSIHPQTSLEHGVITHLKNGKEWQSRAGWLNLSTAAEG